MTSNTECFVYIMLPGETQFTTAGRFVLDNTRQGAPLGRFIYGRRYRDNPDAVPLDPIELGRFAGASNLLSQCRRFALEPDDAARIIEDMEQTAKHRWRPIGRAEGVTEQDCERISGAFGYEGFRGKSVAAEVSLLGEWNVGLDGEVLKPARSVLERLVENCTPQMRRSPTGHCTDTDTHPRPAPFAGHRR